MEPEPDIIIRPNRDFNNEMVFVSKYGFTIHMKPEFARRVADALNNMADELEPTELEVIKLWK